MNAVAVRVAAIVQKGLDEHVQFHAEAQHRPVLVVEGGKERLAFSNVTDIFNAESIGVLDLNLLPQQLQHIFAVFDGLFHLRILLLCALLARLFCGAFRPSSTILACRASHSLLHGDHILTLSVLHLLSLPCLEFHLPDLPPFSEPVRGLQVFKAGVDLLLLDPLLEVVLTFSKRTPSEGHLLEALFLLREGKAGKAVAKHERRDIRYVISSEPDA
mmetsp:Transcript_63528/g.149198  ORF Transcript_63528/g.149198 Transcript_63528/m.149198 type:complete len:216 (-) Transcript_63528:3146-3793(-)